MQGMSMLEPLMNRAARQLGLDEIAIRKINAPSDGSLFGITDTKERPRQRVATARVREALDLGAARFNWSERQRHNGERRGSKVRGVSAIIGAYVAGTSGFDADASRLLALDRDVLGVGVETIGTDAGQAGTFDPPFPNHTIMHGAGKFGLASLCNLDLLPPTGAVVIAAPLKIVDGSGSPLRVLALTNSTTPQLRNAQ